MRLVTALLLATTCSFGLVASRAEAAGFDGQWIAEIPEQGRCDIPGLMTIVVSGHDLMGEVHRTVGGDPKTARIVGKVRDNGEADFTANGFPGSMRFSADRFEATWYNGYCDRHAQGDRALKDTALAALATERRQRQAAYAELVRRADSGDRAVDYTALRAMSVYAGDWDFYGAKVAGLWVQAEAEAKGGDCASALRKLDQVLELDFTHAPAHALRGDCLKQTGDPAQARIEAGIAAGLDRSLMDGGRGDSERAAYVVHTGREENAVLAAKHVRIKTRQTEIRGDDGRYYDVIKGVAVHGAGNASVQSVYFDITSYMSGRTSRQAATATTMATLR